MCREMDGRTGMTKTIGAFRDLRQQIFYMHKVAKIDQHFNWSL